MKPLIPVTSPYPTGRFEVEDFAKHVRRTFPSGCRLTAADVNGNGVINTVDVIAIQRFFLGLTTGIANVGKYQFIPANRTYSGVVSDQTAQNYDTLIFGDVASHFVD